MVEEKCGTCGAVIDAEKEPFTTCSECNDIFCSALHKTCFSDHCIDKQCDGVHATILDPAWTVKIKETHGN